MLRTPETTPSPEQPDQITLLEQALESRRSVLGEEKYLALVKELAHLKEIQKAIDAEKKIIAEKEAALRQASLTKQSESTVPDAAPEVKPTQEIIEKQPIPVINPEIAPIIEDIERDISLENFDSNQLEITIITSGCGLHARSTTKQEEKGRYGMEPIDMLRFYQHVDGGLPKPKDTPWKATQIRNGNLGLVRYYAGTHMDRSATRPERGGGLFTIFLEQDDSINWKSISVKQKNKLLHLLQRTMESIISSNEFGFVTHYGEDNQGVFVRGKIPAEEAVKAKALIQKVVREYQASYEKMHSDVQDTKTEAALQVTQSTPSQEVVQESENETAAVVNEKLEQEESSIEGWEKKYVPFPDVQGFWWNQEKDVLTEQDPTFSAYELFIDPKNPTRAKFRFVDGGNGPKTNPTIQNFDVNIASVANIVEFKEVADARIVQKELGEAKLSPDGTKWEVTKKPDVAVVGPEGFHFKR